VLGSLIEEKLDEEDTLLRENEEVDLEWDVKSRKAEEHWLLSGD